MNRQASEFHEIESRLRRILVAGNHDFGVEVFDCAPVAPGKVVVLLTGSSREWAIEYREVVCRLRSSEVKWRPAGVQVDYRFMALDAMAA